MRYAAVLLLPLAVITCTDGPSSTSPLVRTSGPAAPLIADAAHGGPGGFFFLPPLLAASAPTGAFDAGVSPVVTIEDAAGRAVAEFSMTGGSGSERVRLDAQSEKYIVNWHTGRFNLSAGARYRVRVRVGQVELGFLDVIVTGSGRDKDATAPGAVSVVNGRTVPIAFRVEKGIPGSLAVAPATGSVAALASLDVSATVLDLRGQPLAGVAVSWSVAALSGDADAAGSIDPVNATTDADGRATATFTGGPVAGQVSVTATAGALSASSVVEVTREARPDLVPTACRVVPVDPSEENAVHFVVTVENRGAVDAVFPSNYGMPLALSSGNYAGGISGGLTIAAGGAEDVSVYWPAFSHAPGPQNETVTVEPENRIAELDETNNTIACSFTLTGSPKPDLVISNIATTISPLDANSDFQWLISVKNQGSGAATFHDGAMVVDGGIWSFYVFTPTHAWTLEPGESHTFTVNRHPAFNPPAGSHTVQFTVDPQRSVAESDETNNTRVHTLMVNEPPPPPPVDLVPTACRVSPVSPTDDARVNFYVTIANRGSATATLPSNYGMSIALSGGNYAGGLEGGLSIPAGGSVEVSAYWPPFSHPAGEHTVTATVEPENRVPELDETNNTIVCPTFTLAAAPRPDLVIAAVETTVDPVYPTSDFQWRITVKNQGAAPATFYDGAMVVDGGMSSNYVFPPTSPFTLQPGESHTFTVNRHPAFNPGAGAYTVTFVLDPRASVAESDETNNVHTFTLVVRPQ